MKILLFAGAGRSVELGVPSMAGLATEFLAHTRQWAVEPDLVQKIMASDLDVEHLIEELDRICAAGSSLRSIGHDTGDLESAEKVRAEVEWFVQHAAERIAPRDAQLMWGSVLQATAAVEITFVTTNYDRAIELAANGEGIVLDDGFGPFADGETVQWAGFKHDERRPMLIKLHGSTDWFSDKNTAQPTKLRHPMPLFGRSVLQFEGLKLDSALVLPSREKMLTGAPYPRLSQSFLNVADCCDLALFVGSSLRDNHIRDAARSVLGKAAVFIVNPDGDDCGVEGMGAIAQHASTFLVSTLPNALLASDPFAVLREASEADTVTTQGVLSAVRDLLDTGVEGSRRCHAVEELDERGATLAPLQIERLLAGADSTVARYALGLIPLSTSQEKLIEVAAHCPHTGDPTFREELDILRKLASPKQPHLVTPMDQAPEKAGLQEEGVGLERTMG